MDRKVFDTVCCRSLSIKSYQKREVKTSWAIGKQVIGLINRRFDACFVGYWLTCPILAALPWREASNQQTYQQPLWKTFLGNAKKCTRAVPLHVRWCATIW